MRILLAVVCLAHVLNAESVDIISDYLGVWQYQSGPPSGVEYLLEIRRDGFRLSVNSDSNVKLIIGDSAVEYRTISGEVVILDGILSLSTDASESLFPYKTWSLVRIDESSFGLCPIQMLDEASKMDQRVRETLFIRQD